MKIFLYDFLFLSLLSWSIPSFSYNTIPISDYGKQKDRDCNPIYLKGKTEDYMVEIDSSGFFYHKKNKRRLIHQGRFVMDGSGNIFYISNLDQSQLEKKEGKIFFHSSFLDGGPISMAGTLKFLNNPGILSEVDNGSGDYRPPFSMIKNFDDEVKKRGIKYPYDRIDVAQSWGGLGTATSQKSESISSGSGRKPCTK